jgi:hypothetical protein
MVHPNFLGFSYAQSVAQKLIWCKKGNVFWICAKKKEFLADSLQQQLLAFDRRQAFEIQ